MLLPALIAFGLTLVLSPAALVGLRRLGVMDIPSDRSSHSRPTPRGGGIAVGIGATTALLTASAMPARPWIRVAVAACSFGVVGLLDDLFSVPALWRLAFQVAAAAVVISWLVPSSGRSPILQVGVLALAAMWLVSYVNAYNFMDGINGISVVQALVAGATWVVVAEVRHMPTLALVAAVVGAAAVGFAPFNFPRARMFLGDAGSYFVGAWLAAVVVLAIDAGVPPEAVLAPLALYLADTGVTLVVRVRRGLVWHAAHRGHTYQRLVERGWTHETTTLTVGLVLVVVSGLGLLSLTDSVALRVVGDAIAAAVLAAYLRAPEWLAAHRPAMAPARPL
jgi:UDP-N-acetylmuramyl pentapeptide phosphotransferase/UDP-N-acetylglucosamine-1-phosphate transferase